MITAIKKFFFKRSMANEYERKAWRIELFIKQQEIEIGNRVMILEQRSKALEKLTEELKKLESDPENHKKEMREQIKEVKKKVTDAQEDVDGLAGNINEINRLLGDQRKQVQTNLKAAHFFRISKL